MPAPAIYGDHVAWVTNSSIMSTSFHKIIAWLLYIYLPIEEKRVPGQQKPTIYRSSYILFRVRVKLLLAARGTEIIVLALVVADQLRGLFVHGHLADRINSHTHYTSGIIFCHIRYIRVLQGTDET